MEIIKTYEKKLSCVILKLGLDLLDDDQVTLEGDVELDIENQSCFVDMVNATFLEDIRNIIVDLSLVSYIDSSGLWALFEAHKKAAQHQGLLFLINPSVDVRRVLDVTKISSKTK